MPDPCHRIRPPAGWTVCTQPCGGLRAFVLAAAICFLAAAEPPSGLVGWWRFADGDGRTVKDGSGKGNDGAIVSGELRQEKVGTSLELDGIDGHVSIPERTPFGLRQGITTAIWITVQRLRNNMVLFGIPNANEDWMTPVFGMYLAGTRVVYGQTGDKGVPKAILESTIDMPLGRWTFLAATVDGTVVRLFIDGEPDAELKQPSALAFNGKPLLIGRGLGGKPALKGRIGELRIYDHALSGDAVRSLYQQTRTAYDLSLPARSPCRDGTVPVETHGSSPGGDRPWVAHPTRLLEKLDGYAPAGTRVKLSRFGGWMDRPRETATGFFRTMKIADRWWLIDPDGYRFFHVGINAVREPKDPNHRSATSQEWAEAVTRQLRENGFNGLGNGSSPGLQKVATPLVWVLRRDFIFAFARQRKLVEAAAGTQGFVNHCMPVFHPEFEAFCEEYGRELAATANDPWLLGIMTENELQCPIDLLDRHLAGDPKDPDQKPGHDAAVAWLAARKGPADAKGLTRRDRYEFIAHAFARYYGIVTRIVRRYDPHHLYLGSRLNYHAGEFDNPWFWKMLAPFHDVVSVNYYGQWGPQEDDFADWAAWAGKPILITEWYAKAMDVPGLANTHGAGWVVRTQEDRARYYQHFLLAALETRNIVGSHFFKFLDDPAESTALDAAGGANKGMFDLRGRPYQALLDRACAVNREAYPLMEFFDSRR